MNNKSISWKQVFVLAGALNAYLIGSATATGQESIQFFTSHGYIGIASIIVTLIVFGWASSSLIALGSQSRDMEGNIYQQILGNYFGKIFEWFVTFFLFSLTITLVSGSGTIIADFYQLPKIVGALLMTVLIFLTVLLSLQKLVDLLSFIAPIIIVFTTIISIVSIYNSFGNAFIVNDLLTNVQVDKAVNSWFLSGLLYATFGVTIAAPFLLKVGTTTDNRREAIYGGLIGALVYGIAVSIISFALLINIDVIYDKETPLVFLAEGFHPIFGILFSIIILAGIYTTGAPMFWYVSSALVEDGTPKHRLVSAILIVIILIGGIYLPFGKLVGTIYPVAGVFGIILLAVLLFKQIRHRLQSLRKSKMGN
ncbi:MAG TPA: hypothetical protein VFF20_05140 [Pseudogracilibacillus sp.]|nr:hypothetical protein [Pseudogracilibacillus sp.]